MVFVNPWLMFINKHDSGNAQHALLEHSVQSFGSKRCKNHILHYYFEFSRALNFFLRREELKKWEFQKYFFRVMLNRK